MCPHRSPGTGEKCARGGGGAGGRVGSTREREGLARSTGQQGWQKKLGGHHRFRNIPYDTTRTMR